MDLQPSPEPDERRAPMMQMWQLDNLVLQLDQEIDSTIRKLDLSEQATLVELKYSSKILKKQFSDYTELSRQLSIRLLKRGSIQESQEARNDRSRVHHEVKEALVSINAVMSNLTLELQSNISATTPIDFPIHEENLFTQNQSGVNSSKNQASIHPSQNQPAAPLSQNQPAVPSSQDQAAVHPSQDQAAVHSSQDQAAFHPSQDQAAVHHSQDQAAVHHSQDQAAVHPVQDQAAVHTSQEKTSIQPTREEAGVHPTQRKVSNQPSRQEADMPSTQDQSDIQYSAAHLNIQPTQDLLGAYQTQRPPTFQSFSTPKQVDEYQSCNHQRQKSLEDQTYRKWSPEAEPESSSNCLKTHHPNTNPINLSLSGNCIRNSHRTSESPHSEVNLLHNFVSHNYISNGSNNINVSHDTTVPHYSNSNQPNAKRVSFETPYRPSVYQSGPSGSDSNYSINNCSTNNFPSDSLRQSLESLSLEPNTCAPPLETFPNSFKPLYVPRQTQSYSYPLTRSPPFESGISYNQPAAPQMYDPSFRHYSLPQTPLFPPKVEPPTSFPTMQTHNVPQEYSRSGLFPLPNQPTCPKELSPLEVFSKHLLQQDLLKKVIEPFDGAATNFWPWYSKMINYINSLTLSPLHTLQLFETHCRGGAQKYISNKLASTGEVTVEDVEDTIRGLISRYGSTQRITSELLTKIDAFPAVKGPNIGDQLLNLQDLCCIISYNMKKCPELQALNLSSGLRPLRTKLPDFLQNEWRRCGQSYEDSNFGTHPPFSVFINFLDRQSRQLSNRNYETQPYSERQRNVRAFQTSTYEMKPKSNLELPPKPPKLSELSLKFCRLHKTANHSLADCVTFRKLAYPERKNFIKEHKLCYKCLGDHMISNCTSSVSCDICGKHHVTALHRDSDSYPKYTPIEKSHPNTPLAQRPKLNSLAMCTKLCNNPTAAKNCSKTLLVVLTMDGVTNKSLLCYCIVDEQSNTTLVDEQVVDFFGKEFPRQDYSMKFATEACELSSSGCLVTGLRVRGVYEKESISIDQALSCSEIADTTHEVATPSVVKAHPLISQYSKYFPEFNSNAKVLVLIGRNVGRAMATQCLTTEEPYVHRTPLGFSLVGNTCITDSSESSVCVLRTSLSSFDPVQVKLPFLPTTNQKLSFETFAVMSDDDVPGFSQDDKLFLDIVSANITTTKSGNIELPLPLKTSDLPDNKDAVFMRSKATLSRLKCDPQKLSACLDSMRISLQKSYVEELPKWSKPSKPTWYLPIFCVTQPKKEKVRLVFDAAARFKGISLNDCLLQGPDLYNELRGVLLRFRERPIAFGADIEQMFSNFKVPLEQQDLLRFFWFRNNDPTNEIVPYRSSSHIFGCNSSPAIANLAMKHLASVHLPTEYSPAKDYLCNSFYVDDGLMSVDTPEEAINILTGARSILSTFNTRLHKIASNSAEVLDSFPSSEIATKSTLLPNEKPSPQNTLGLSWNTVTDKLEVKASTPLRPFTKRGVLSVVNSLFDPLGIICPAVLGGRLIQRAILSTAKSDEEGSDTYDWDDPLPETLKSQWDVWISSLLDLSSLQIPRSLLPSNFTPVSQELHIFSDASDHAIGHVSYLRSEDSLGSIHVGFITGASKVAPRCATSIPRLELCAAVESAICASAISHDLKFKPSCITLYTDSQIVLGYLRNKQRRFSKYIERRVQAILNLSDVEQWKYVGTGDNPADIATRPHSPKQLLSSIWFSGPSFLSDRSIQSLHPSPLQVLPEEKIVTSVLLTMEKSSIFSSLYEKTNSFEKLLRIVGQVLRFCSVVTKQSILYTHQECLKVLVCEAQQTNFSSAISAIRKTGHAPENDPISALSPFIDPQGIVRVGGRLKRANIAFSAKHPILIPNKHPLSLIIVEHLHRKIKHQGAYLSHAAVIREGFHIQGGRRLIRSFVSSCVLCKKLRGLPCKQLMADLPADRLEETPPFTNVGLDVFGPFYVSNGRKTRSSLGCTKVWVVIFVCLPSRAIHLEPLLSMDTSSFRNALTRFFAIRGCCKLIRSDCGSNFIGARRQMNEVDFEAISTELEQRSIIWKMNPPHASHFGGVWERKIGSVRRVFEGSLALMEKRYLSHDEFTTLLAEASQIVNNSPLWSVPSSPNDPMPLSPAMLLTLHDEPNPAPCESYSDKDILAYGPRRYRRVQYLSNQFWVRWRTEFLHTLTKRHKWKSKQSCISVGDVVLMRDRQSPRNHWPMGRISNVKTSDDGLVRSVTLTLPPLPGGSKPRSLNRPICELVLLVPHISHACPFNPASPRQDGGGVSRTCS